MTEQNQTPDTAADDTEGHVHFRMSEVDDAAGHAFHTDEEAGTPARRNDEDVQGHFRTRDADDADDDDAEGHLHRI